MTVRPLGSGGIIYYRGSRTDFSKDIYLLLHELVHIAYPEKLTKPGSDLDIILANDLELKKLNPNETAAEAVSRFFNNNCDPSLRDF